MKFSIGDKVLLKQTNEEGHVTAYINDLMIEVEVGGVSFPIHIDDVDHPYLKWFTDKTKKKKQSLPEQLPVERIIERKQRLAKGVYLSFMPVYIHDGFEEVVEQLKVYLLNELPVSINYTYDVKYAMKSDFRHTGSLHAFGNVYLHSVNYADMNDQPRFNWELTDPANVNMDTATGVLRIKPAKLFEHISQLQVSGEPSFSYMLINEFAPKKKQEIIEKFEHPKPKVESLITHRTIEQPKFELDLHIEALIDNRKGLSNADIVNVQLETLRHYLQLAIVHRQERMIIIHGLGKGKLREDVHQILKQIPEISRFKNEWSGRYGFGATEVWFRHH